MAVAFTDLYTFIRAVLGDNDQDFQMYSDDVLKAQLTLLSMENTDWPLEDQVSFKDLPATEQARIVLYTARNILSPTPGNFSYRTPILSVQRQGGPGVGLLNIEQRIASLEATRMIAHDSDVEALLQLGPSRLPYVDVAYGEIGNIP